MSQDRERGNGLLPAIRQALPLSHGAAIPNRNRKRSQEFRLKKAKQNRLNYRKRRASGLCTYGHCPKRAESGHADCRKHLRAMSKRAGERRNERIEQGLCVSCGERPQFWGRRCIICRQVLAKDPLPKGAKRALRFHREAKTRRLVEQLQSETRAAALKLLAGKSIKDKNAQALRLYLGLDNGNWRTYKEVGEVMNISKERVRQLLLPSKVTLTATLAGRVPWRPLKQDHLNREGKTHTSLSTPCTLCNHLELKETVWIPNVSDLHIKLAKVVLLKPTALTGEDLRFLRGVAGLSTVSFAAQLGVAIQTIQSWEKAEALRYLNDLGARMVLAALIAPGEDWSPICGIVSSIKARGTRPDRVRAFWTKEEARWIVTSSVA